MKIDRSKGFFNATKQSDKKAKMDIFGEIVDDQLSNSQTSAISFRDALNSFGDVEEIEINLNSPGGSVFSGIAIANQISSHSARVTVNISGVAASIASVIAISADHVKMAKNSMMMIHEVWSPFVGSHNEMRKFADDLEKINETVFNSYLQKNPKIDHALLKDMMAKETWLSSDEALELGLIDEVTQANKASAKISKEMEAQFKNMPELNNDVVETPKETEEVTVDDVMAILKAIQSDVKEIKENTKTKEEKEEKSDETKTQEVPVNSFARLFNLSREDDK
ncbi:head maturation protease, ClpP-related [Mammaliicoccus vitulinus]|uniref:head maturation protease, ClpP-related n=1 Tax=Mammaliicoccus vitulinus TaxID=71237 RepID=UPI0028D50392|nr:head maturation protease, ClpP-related [Mammaliicoccus vitulinus]